MARYDRIAALPLPAREKVFAGWTALADLDRHERDAAFAHWALLYFSAARVLHRIAGRLQEYPIASVRQQIERIAAGAGRGDAAPERPALSALLSAVEAREAAGIVNAALRLARAAQARAHYSAAEEIAAVALAIAQQQGGIDLTPALTQLAAAARLGGRPKAAAEFSTQSLAEAEAGNDALAYARAASEEVIQRARQGDSAGADALLDALNRRAPAVRTTHVVSAMSLAVGCAAAATGDAETAVVHGWMALQREDDRIAHVDALLLIGPAFRQLGLYGAAEACYARAGSLALSVTDRARAAAGLAVCAAEGGTPAAALALCDSVAQLLPRVADLPGAEIRLDVAAALLQCGEHTQASEFARASASRGRNMGDRGLVAAAERLLAEIETARAGGLLARQRPHASPPVEMIARSLLELLGPAPDHALKV